MIGPYLDGGLVLDLFAGSGGLAIEAVFSRRRTCHLCRSQLSAIKIIREKYWHHKGARKVYCFKMDAKQALKEFVGTQQQFDYIFWILLMRSKSWFCSWNKWYKRILWQLMRSLFAKQQKKWICQRGLAHWSKVDGRWVYGITAVTIYRNEG